MQQNLENNTSKETVLKQYPHAYCDDFKARQLDGSYIIWGTREWYMPPFLASGGTEDEAWDNAAKKLNITCSVTYPN